jgi:hypothetical protein
MAAKVGTNLLIVNTPLCTTNQRQKLNTLYSERYKTIFIRIIAFHASITENLTLFMSFFEESDLNMLVINCNSAIYAT